MILPTAINETHPDTLPNGLLLARYSMNTKNRPSDYGVIIYITHKADPNLWCTAIAFSTDGAMYTSFKTNADEWSKWILIVKK